MSDFVLVDPKNWECDLHSVYSAYIGYFQMYNIPWYERSWGHFFDSFDEFLGFSWPVITVTDAFTGRAHIVTKMSAIHGFIKMIKTRFGETLPQAPNILIITPFETAQRRVRHISDYATYTRLHATLPAAILAALKARIKAGEPRVVKDLWEKREKTFLAIDFEVNERNEKTVLEFGYAAVRCGHLDALGHWPPNPDTNYRKGHYIVAEHVDKIVNKHSPTYPWLFGDSQTIPKAKLPQVIQTVISSLISPESETSANTLVLVGHGLQPHLARLEDMKIRLPANLLILDTMVLEKSLYAAGMRSPMMDPSTGQLRAHGTSLSLEKLLISFTLPNLPTSSDNSGQGRDSSANGQQSHGKGSGSSSSRDKDREKESLPVQVPIVLPQCTLHNAGNDAFMTLYALQKLMEPGTTRVPTAQKVHYNRGMGMGMVGGAGWAVQMGMGGMPGMGGMGMPMSPHGMVPALMVPSPSMNSFGGGVPFPYGSMPNMSGNGFGGGTGQSQSLGVKHLGGRERARSSYTLADEFGAMSLGAGGSGAGRERKVSGV
ncbi:hypothetical protein CC2G_000204 [Coprinopsis cinerea AmutBmut pab1-1]|nr:hypothetical protein CC2G_000204 [Coprinopsis cinerea AmutBmut pab1-1]